MFDLISNWVGIKKNLTIILEVILPYRTGNYIFLLTFILLRHPHCKNDRKTFEFHHQISCHDIQHDDTQRNDIRHKISAE